MNDLSKSIESFLLECGGCRTGKLTEHFLPGRGHSSDEITEFWRSVDMVEGVEFDDVGDEDCPKPYIYLAR